MAKDQDLRRVMKVSLENEDYQVSPTHGFLPSESPIEKLPMYYKAWEDICANLYKLRINNQLTDRVARLAVLNTTHLKNEPEWRRAYVLLTFIASAYIWGPEKPLEVRLSKGAAMGNRS